MWKYLCFLYVFSDDETFGYEIWRECSEERTGFVYYWGNKTDP